MNYTADKGAHDMQIISDKEFNRFSISAVDFEKALQFANETKKHPANNTESFLLGRSS